ncbi:MAG: Ldh family oxidoreductase, partial [Oscillibacter sp.]|nr:Ldh family oxidoreductase [Oscillibacter sp.]
MQYHHVAYEPLKTFCQEVFRGYGFSPEEAAQITAVLLEADLSGIESHGIQRLIRYHQEITGGLVKLDA